MKKLAFVISIGIGLSSSSWANIIPSLSTITGAGPSYTYDYTFTLSGDQSAVSGPAPTTPQVPQTSTSAFLTIYDFNGYVNGSCTGPSGWTCTSQLTGFTPSNVSPLDSDSLFNITWSYTSGATIGASAGPDIELGSFTAQSIFNQTMLVSYAARGMKNNGASSGTAADNVGQTAGPVSSTPEPVSFLSMGVGLGIVGLIRRRRKSVA